MTSILKKATALFLSVALALTASFAVSAIAPADAQASTKPYMKTLKLKWDLKKNKTTKFTQKWVGLGNMDTKVKISNYKITNTKNDMKKLTFKITYTWNNTFTKMQVHKMVKSDRNYKLPFTNYYFAIVDYDSGKSLETDNDFGVTVKSGGWKYTKYKKTTDSHGCWVRIAKNCTVKVTITYPKDYKSLCIGVGSNNLFVSKKSISRKSIDTKFDNGKVKFGKTTYYTKGKSNSHWMRVK